MTRRWLRHSGCTAICRRRRSVVERTRARWCFRSRRVVLRLVRVLGQPVRAPVNAEQAAEQLPTRTIASASKTLGTSSSRSSGL